MQIKHFLRLSVAEIIVFSALVGQGIASPRQDFRVTKPETAVAIARAAFEQEFGRDELRKIKSVKAELKGDRWVVHLRSYKDAEIPPHGGTIDIEVAVERGSVLSVTAEM